MTYDFCILGAGIAGLSLADALQEQSYSVLVVEKEDIAAGASGTPGGLVNPATGRKGKKTWKAGPCYHAIRRNLEKVQAFAEAPFFRRNGLLRPALTQEMAHKMRKQYDETHWPGGWCKWQTEAEIKNRHPGINCVEGGLWLPIGLTVNVEAYLKAYANFLRSKEVAVKIQYETNLHQKNGFWQIHTSVNQFKSNHLVFATGYATVNHPYWNNLPLEGVKGQVARFRSDSKLLSFNHSISSMGYIARLGIKDEFIQGSTYDHDFDNLETNETGRKYLLQRLQKTLPQLAKNVMLIDQWAGVRVNTPNRKPLLGPHPEIPNLHVFTGLGSKGLMYGKFLADHYADHFTNGTAIYPEISINRFG